MESKIKQDLIFLRLFPDEKIHEKIVEASKKYKVKTAVILSGIGQLKKIKLGYFKEKNNYAPEDFSKPHELLSLSGNIVFQDEEYLTHFHAVLGLSLIHI